MLYNELGTDEACGANGFAQRRAPARQGGRKMTDIAENASPLEAAEASRMEVDEFLARVRQTVARTREVIQATQERLGPTPGASDGE
jgi:hypothetical protein